MKKLITIASTLAILTTSSALAKTEGSYVGLNIIKTDMEAEKMAIGEFNFTNEEMFQVQDQDQVSIGINYKYAFNFGGIFIAPGVFFDYSNISTKGEITDGASTSWDLDYRYGARIDLGYDITNALSAYVHAGATNNVYSNSWNFAGNFSQTSGSDIAPSYGIGMKYSVSDKLDLNLEYEVSEFEMEVTLPTNTTNTQEFELNVIRAGIAFKF